MYLKKYTTDQFLTLHSWVENADMLFRFAGTAWKYPLTELQITDYQLQHPERQFYMAYLDDTNPFAFGEIIVNDINTPRLGRLLVGGESSRGKGLGGKLIELLIQECMQQLAPKVIYLYVFENNLPAIRCYEKAGFVTDPGNKIIFNHDGTEHVALVMQYMV